MRPGDPPTIESARSLFYGMFFDAKRYDFSRVGRFKFNIKLNSDVSVEQKTLTADDSYGVVEYLLPPPSRTSVGWTISTTSAIAGCARAESCSENQFRVGLVRMEAGDQGKDVGPSGHRFGDAARV